MLFGDRVGDALTNERATATALFIEFGAAGGPNTAVFGTADADSWWAAKAGGFGSSSAFHRSTADDPITPCKCLAENGGAPR